MSTTPPPPPDDDPLARATAALRRTRVPEGPSEETLARTLAALRAAAGGPDVIPVPRRHLMLMTLKIAGAVLATAGGWFYLAGPSPVEANVTFAEVAQKIHDARTLSYRMTMRLAGQDPQTARLLYRVPGLIRSESEPSGGPVAIMDTTRGKTLILDPARKSALLLEGPPLPGRGPKADVATAMVDDLRRLAGKEGEPAGEKTIGGVRARGFRVKENGQDLTVWVDPKAGLPVLVEVEGQVGGKDVLGTLDDIQLDPDLDEALFRFDPPAGYTLRKAEAKLALTTEDAVARVLRTYAERTGGSFPSRLDDLDAFQKAAAVKPDRSPSEADAFELAVAMGHLFAFTSQQKGRYGYKPDGIKLGDADKILFWYQPEGATKYRAVFGDLRVGDVSADQVPEKPKP